MQAFLGLSTWVQSGGRIEIADTQLPEGERVDVIVQIPSTAKEARHSIADVLAQTPGRVAFKSASEVDLYLEQERQSWDC